MLLECLKSEMTKDLLRNVKKFVEFVESFNNKSPEVLINGKFSKKPTLNNGVKGQSYHVFCTAYTPSTFRRYGQDSSFMQTI